MSIAPGATFDYVATAPDLMEGTWSCPVQLASPLGPRGAQERLVGHAPRLEVAPAGMTPEEPSPPSRSPILPRVLRSRMTIHASDPRHAVAKSVAFHVDAALTATLRPRDVLSMSRTDNAGLALSIVRDGQLVAAAGAVSAVPLGDLVRVRVPHDLVQQAEAIFQSRDPDFEFPLVPIEVTIRAQSLIMYRGRTTLDGFGVFVEHGVDPMEAGFDACAAIWRIGACADAPAIASAQLLDAEDALQIVGW